MQSLQARLVNKQRSGRRRAAAAAADNCIVLMFTLASVAQECGPVHPLHQLQLPTFLQSAQYLFGVEVFFDVTDEPMILTDY